jgi:hypothetical protein
MGHLKRKICVKAWWARRDLNPQPKDYESSALTVELRARLLLSVYRSLLVYRFLAAVDFAGAVFVGDFGLTVIACSERKNIRR